MPTDSLLRVLAISENPQNAYMDLDTETLPMPFDITEPQQSYIHGFSKHVNSMVFTISPQRKRYWSSNLFTKHFWSTSHSEPRLEAIPLRSIFSELVANWKSETGGISSPDEICMHPAYQQIIGMGPAALPLIFEELSVNGGDWYWALCSITRHDPVPDESVGIASEMKTHWLDYASEHNYI